MPCLSATVWMTSARWSDPSSRRHFLLALNRSLNTMASAVLRERQPGVSLPRGAESCCTYWQAPGENAEKATSFFHDMRARTLGNSLLTIRDGAPGIIKAIEICVPR